jgi:hypothetical protein
MDAGGSTMLPASSATGQEGRESAEIVTPPAAVLQFKSKMSPVHKYSPSHQVFQAQHRDNSRSKMSRIEREEAPYLWPTLDETASPCQDMAWRALDAQEFSSSEGLSRYLHGPQAHGRDQGVAGDSKQMQGCLWRPRDPREYAECDVLMAAEGVEQLHRGALPARGRQRTHSQAADTATCEEHLTYQAEARGDADGGQRAHVRPRLHLAVSAASSRRAEPLHAPLPLSYSAAHPTFYSRQAGTGHDDAAETGDKSPPRARATAELPGRGRAGEQGTSRAAHARHASRSKPLSPARMRGTPRHVHLSDSGAQACRKPATWPSRTCRTGALRTCRWCSRRWRGGGPPRTCPRRATSCRPPRTSAARFCPSG